MAKTIEEKVRQAFFHDDIPETGRVETTVEKIAEFADKVAAPYIAENSKLKAALRQAARYVPVGSSTQRIVLDVLAEPEPASPSPQSSFDPKNCTEEDALKFANAVLGRPR